MDKRTAQGQRRTCWNLYCCVNVCGWYQHSENVLDSIIALYNYGLKERNNLFSLVVLIMSASIHCELLQIWKKFNIKTKNGNIIFIYIFIYK